MQTNNRNTGFWAEMPFAVKLSLWGNLFTIMALTWLWATGSTLFILATAIFVGWNVIKFIVFMWLGSEGLSLSNDSRSAKGIVSYTFHYAYEHSFALRAGLFVGFLALIGLAVQQAYLEAKAEEIQAEETGVIEGLWNNIKSRF